METELLIHLCYWYIVCHGGTGCERGVLRFQLNIGSHRRSFVYRRRGTDLHRGTAMDYQEPVRTT